MTWSWFLKLILSLCSFVDELSFVISTAAAKLLAAFEMKCLFHVCNFIQVIIITSNVRGGDSFTACCQGGRSGQTGE